MNVEIPLAHSASLGGGPQPLVEHLRSVAALAEGHASKFGAGPLGRWAGLWHDLGKFSPVFQAYLRDPRRSHGPDHSSAGAILAADVYQPLAFPIAGHHAGLPSRTALKDRLAEKAEDRGIRRALEIAAAYMPDLRPHHSVGAQVPSFVATTRRETHELFIRMLFSALVDADYLDTERHFVPQQARMRGGAPSLDTLWDRLIADQDQFADAPATVVNQIRREVFDQCVAAARQSPGVFSLTVPTGGGKTRSSLAFALRHALTNSLDRVIVGIPYTSIIEQTADVYRTVFGPEAILEHHSAIDPDRLDDGARPDWSRLASENWDASIIVTTTVQLFESLFADRPVRCRKLHNVARSVVVLDEVQTLPPHLLTPILDVLRELVAHYGVTVVLCTATQPALLDSPYLAGFPEIREIVPHPERYFRALRRVRYELPTEPWPWPQVAAAMREEAQALAVVNTKRDVLALLDALDGEDVFHLSTLLCGAHRRDVLREVRRRLAAARPCRLVSTQVVEAGVDLDFPVVLRAVGPLDRIVQAAGRCNREGRLREGRTVVFEAEGGTLPRGAYRTATETARILLRSPGFDFHDPAWYAKYFVLLYQARDLDEQRIQELRAALNYPETARRFRLIDEDTVPVVVPYRGRDGTDRTVDDLLAAVRALGEIPQAVFRRLQPFLVQLWRREAEAQARVGQLEELRPGLWEWLGGYDALRGITDATGDPGALVA